MARKNRQPAPTEPLTVQARVIIADRIAAVVIRALTMAGFVGVMYMVYLSINALAGQHTDANINTSFSLKIFASRYVADIAFFIFGCGGIGYGYGQNRLYKKVAVKLKRLDGIEKKVDPNRTSSGLIDGWRGNDDDNE